MQTAVSSETPTNQILGVDKFAINTRAVVLEKNDGYHPIIQVREENSAAEHLPN